MLNNLEEVSTYLNSEYNKWTWLNSEYTIGRKIIVGEYCGKIARNDFASLTAFKERMRRDIKLAKSTVSYSSYYRMNYQILTDLFNAMFEK